MNELYEVMTAGELDGVYNEGYFHGRGSGYGTEGYEREHADWSTWMQWLQGALERSVLWLDLGCAYGYLIEQAAACGVEAIGLDVSSYALRRLPSSRGSLVQGLAEQLPFPDHTFDAVSLFDLIEHALDPGLILDEVERVLKPDGFCFLTTPDPCHFHRDEPTHVFERPPSFWVALFEKRGWNVAIRFGDQDYEFEMTACRKPPEDWKAISDWFAEVRCPWSAKVHRSGAPFFCVPRVDASNPESRSFYLLNPNNGPLRLTPSFVTTDESHPDLFLNDFKLGYFGCERKPKGVLHRWSPVVMPPGGRDLCLKNQADFQSIKEFYLEAETVDPQAFLIELPFDHYQRYRLVADWLEQIEGKPLRVLDVGGALGHLPLFLHHHEVTVLDQVWEDHPSAICYPGGVLPFPDGSFDVVTAVDTLEHIPPQDRSNFLRELCRIAREAVLVCGPCDEPDVEEVEWALHDFLTHHLNRHDRFLDEHRQFGLPNYNEILDCLREAGLSLVDFPNGYLPRWLAMQMVTFALSSAPELDEGSRRINALYNRHYFGEDNRLPAYRWLIAGFRGEIPSTILQWENAPSASRRDAASIWSPAALITSLSTLGLLREKESYLSEQGQRLERLLDHIQNLENALTEERKHTANLDQIIQQQASQIEGLQKHADNLSHALEDQKPERENWMQVVNQVQAHNQELIQHGKNLETLLEENRKHTRNLESMIQQYEKIFREVQLRIGFHEQGDIHEIYPRLESILDRFVEDNRLLHQHNVHLISQYYYISQSYAYRFFRMLRMIPAFTLEPADDENPPGHS